MFFQCQQVKVQIIIYKLLIEKNKKLESVTNTVVAPKLCWLSEVAEKMTLILRFSWIAGGRANRRGRCPRLAQQSWGRHPRARSSRATAECFSTITACRRTSSTKVRQCMRGHERQPNTDLSHRVGGGCVGCKKKMQAGSQWLSSAWSLKD